MHVCNPTLLYLNCDLILIPDPTLVTFGPVLCFSALPIISSSDVTGVEQTICNYIKGNAAGIGPSAEMNSLYTSETTIKYQNCKNCYAV